MAEYGREQRNQLSRAVANSETGSRQLKGFVDNRKGDHKQSNLLKSTLLVSQRKAYICERPLNEIASPDANPKEDLPVSERKVITKGLYHAHVIFDTPHVEVSSRIMDSSKGGNDGRNIGFHSIGGVPIGKGALFCEPWQSLNYSIISRSDFGSNEDIAAQAVEEVEPEGQYVLGIHDCQDYCRKICNRYIEIDEENKGERDLYAL